jgi:putative endonuclease
MNTCVYVLRSRSGRFYYGSTNDLPRRLEQHARGHTATTARDGPWELVGSHVTETLEAARALERQFKRWKNPQRVLAWLARAGEPAAQR